jgi:hypothetical protein
MPEPEITTERPSPREPRAERERKRDTERTEHRRRYDDDETSDERAERRRDRSPDAGDGEDVADVAYFYDALDEGGQWISHPRFGEVWQPNVDEGWRPYTLGRWAYADDYGWTWVSEEPFGWAVYHYGRWTNDNDLGWVWVPGTEWGPAWVAWRHSEDAIGWAPLPPAARFAGGRMAVDAALLEGERFERGWVFVRPRYFARPEMRRYVRPPSWNSDLVSRTTPRLGYERGSRGIVNHGLPPEDVEKLASRPVPRVRIAPVDDPNLRRPDRFDDWRGKRANEVKIYRPDRKRTAETLKKSRRVNKNADGGEHATRRKRTSENPARSDSATPQALPPGIYPGGRKPSDTAVMPAPQNAPKAVGAPAVRRPSQTSNDAVEAKSSTSPANARSDEDPASGPSGSKSYGEPYDKNYGETREGSSESAATTPSRSTASRPAPVAGEGSWNAHDPSRGKSTASKPPGEAAKSDSAKSENTKSESGPSDEPRRTERRASQSNETGNGTAPATGSVSAKKRWDGSGPSGSGSAGGAEPKSDAQP